MRLCKATIYYFEPNEEGSTADEIITYTLSNGRYTPNYDIYDKKEIEIGEWHDDIDLNKHGCNKETYEKYFRVEEVQYDG